jgi:hypothetical protein
MKVELLYTGGCANVERARTLLLEVLREEGVTDPVQETRVDSMEQAVALRFPGTPTIRIDGLDVDRSARCAVIFTLEPRLYIRAGMLTGCPTRGAIRDVVCEAIEKAKSSRSGP